MADDTFVIGERSGYTPRIGLLVSELQNARHYLLRATRELSVAELDAKPGAAKNSIGAILAHLDAAENMFQRILFEGRRFNEEEMPLYNPPFEFEGGDRTHGRDIDSYHRDLDETRVRTLAGLRQHDDAWLDTPKTFMKQPSNIFYYWFHYIQDEARHTGQVILIRKHLMVGADPGFEPYRP
jgi:uncharacterized damage-inducible protein DinB